MVTIEETFRLEANGIGVSFAGVTALVDVTLEITEREIVGLIGPNGAGKTTLVNVLSGFQKPVAGSFSVNGLSATGWPTHRLARAGVVRTFQSVRLFQGLTVRENVEAAAFAAGMSRSEARTMTTNVLAQLSLDSMEHLEARALSYGQERRLGIARALAAKPRILLLDEPAAGLNEMESDELLGTLRDVHEANSLGMLIIEHDMRLIMRLCDRLHVLDYGRTIATGTPIEVAEDARVLQAYLGHRHGVALSDENHAGS